MDFLLPSLPLFSSLFANAEDFSSGEASLGHWIDSLLATTSPLWHQSWFPYLLAVAVALSLASILATAMAFRRAAYFDPQTGLANRGHFLRRLERALAKRPEALSAVLLLDLDRFQSINESLGHAVGDTLLERVADRLRSLAGPGAILSRLSGDEYALLLTNAEDGKEVGRFAERIQESLSVPHWIDGTEVFNTASVGIVINQGRYQRAEHMLRDADAAMTQAKERAPGGCQIFSAARHRRAVELFRQESELRRALDERQLELYYQPIFALATGGLAGFEALLRWRHPSRGLVLPGEFLAAAESTGLIVAIEGWSLPAACHQLRAWQREHLSAKDLFVNVNLASQQFLQPKLAERIGGALAASGLAPESLRIEITETAIMEHSQQLMEALDQLRQLAVDLYIDDFGTGHSSLAYLQRFPAVGLKIDRSFVQALDGRAAWGQGSLGIGRPVRGGARQILRTIVQLGQSLGLKVVAEGIENPEQLSYLRSLGCDLGQGYLLGRPMPAGDVGRWLRAGGDSTPLPSSA